MERELWRPVVGYEGVYSVSSRGRVRSFRVSRRGRIMRTATHGGGYRSIGLRLAGQPRTYLVHALVMAAFVGPCPPGHEVNHLDFDRANNAESNLEYTTHGGNLKHSFDHGRLHPPVLRGEAHGSAKLTADVVRTLRAARATGETTQSISVRTGVSKSTVESVVYRRSWRHIA